MSSSQPELGVDKEALYGEYMARTRWQDKLLKRGCHKVLDIPEDDGLNINQHGITGRHLVAIAGIVLMGLLGWRALAPVEPLTSTAPAAPVSVVQEYEVSFWAEDGADCPRGFP